MAIFVWFLPVSAARGNGTEDIKIHKSTIFAAEYLTQYASNWRRSPADLTKIWKNKYLTQYSRNWSRLNQTWRKFERICQLPVSNERNLFIIWHNNPVTGRNWIGPDQNMKEYASCQSLMKETFSLFDTILHKLVSNESDLVKIWKNMPVASL